MLGVNYQPRGGGYLYSNISQSYSQCGPDWVLKSSGPEYESDQETRRPLTSHLSQLCLVAGPGRGGHCLVVIALTVLITPSHHQL